MFAVVLCKWLKTIKIYSWFIFIHYSMVANMKVNRYKVEMFHSEFSLINTRWPKKTCPAILFLPVFKAQEE